MNLMLMLAMSLLLSICHAQAQKGYEQFPDRIDISLITFRWDDPQRKLTISSREGSFPGMLKERRFTIVRVTRKKGSGMNTADLYDTVVTYDGKKVVVTLQ